mgnify:CR=1 FL=1|jgi:hypothetical protein
MPDAPHSILAGSRQSLPAPRGTPSRYEAFPLLAVTASSTLTDPFLRTIPVLLGDESELKQLLDETAVTDARQRDGQAGSQPLHLAVRCAKRECPCTTASALQALVS